MKGKEQGQRWLWNHVDTRRDEFDWTGQLSLEKKGGMSADRQVLEGHLQHLVGLDDLRSLFQPMILWFYDSMILWFYDSLTRAENDHNFTVHDQDSIWRNAWAAGSPQAKRRFWGSAMVHFDLFSMFSASLCEFFSFIRKRRHLSGVHAVMPRLDPSSSEPEGRQQKTQTKKHLCRVWPSLALCVNQYMGETASSILSLASNAARVSWHVSSWLTHFCRWSQD